MWGVWQRVMLAGLVLSSRLGFKQQKRTQSSDKIFYVFPSFFYVLTKWKKKTSWIPKRILEPLAFWCLSGKNICLFVYLLPNTIVAICCRHMFVRVTSKLRKISLHCFSCHKSVDLVIMLCMMILFPSNRKPNKSLSTSTCVTSLAHGPEPLMGEDIHSTIQTLLSWKHFTNVGSHFQFLLGCSLVNWQNLQIFLVAWKERVIAKLAFLPLKPFLCGFWVWGR